VSRPTRHRSSERGAVAVIVGILLSVLIGFLAMVMNIGHSRMVRGQLQNAVDAGALAASYQLNGMATGVTLATNAAITFTGNNDTDRNTPVAITGADVQVGHWDFTQSKATAFTSLAATPANLPLMNAVRVIAGRETSRANAVPIWMPSFLTTNTTMNVTAEAVAVGGGPLTNAGCALPFVVPSCAIPNTFLTCCATNPGSSACDVPVHFVLQATFASDGVDTIGMTNLQPSGASNADFRAMIADPNSCPKGTSGSDIAIQNGDSFNKPFYDDMKAWLAAHDNGGLVSIATMDGCPNPKYNQDAILAGFASVHVTLEPWTGGKTPKFAMNGTLLCTKSNSIAGGGFYGTAPNPGLVR